MQIDIQLHAGRNLDIVTQVETLGAHGRALSEDYSLYTAGAAMLETADRLVEAEHEPAVPQYWLLAGALRALAQREHVPGLVLDSYLLRALAIAGWAPSFDVCAVTGARGPHTVFVPQLGGVVADEVAPPGAPRLDLATLALLGALLEGRWADTEEADERARAQASGIVAAYTQFHLERTLRSLPHVDRDSA